LKKIICLVLSIVFIFSFSVSPLLAMSEYEKQKLADEVRGEHMPGLLGSGAMLLGGAIVVAVDAVNFGWKTDMWGNVYQPDAIYWPLMGAGILLLGASVTVFFLNAADMGKELDEKGYNKTSLAPVLIPGIASAAPALGLGVRTVF
jgi:di/tricarboxylate transporter